MRPRKIGKTKWPGDVAPARLVARVERFGASAMRVPPTQLWHDRSTRFRRQDFLRIAARRRKRRYRETVADGGPMSVTDQRFRYEGQDGTGLAGFRWSAPGKS